MLHLSRHYRAAIIAHARKEAPAEACGILAGRGERVCRLYRLRNVAPEAGTRYLAKPEEQLRAFQDMERRGLEMLAIYHSHPQSPAYPSPTDVSLAYYPETRYVIVSLARLRGQVRCFRIVHGQISQEPLQL